MAGDLNWTTVVLASHFDGANNSTTFTDASASAHGLAAVGSSKLTTTSPKFGTASVNITGGLEAVSVSGTVADFNFGAGQFTIECWANTPTTITTGLRTFAAQFGGSTNLGWYFGFNGTALSFFYSTTGTNNPAVSGTYNPTTNTWVHYAVDRDGSNAIRVYANGVVIGGPTTVASTFFASTQAACIGNDNGLLRGWAGTLDDLRICKGLARYAGAFTPPSSAFPTGAFTADSAPIVVVMA